MVKYFGAFSVALAALILIHQPAAADLSAVCEDLSQFSCAPGSYNDGTGEVKGESEIADYMTAYSEKSKALLRAKFSVVVNDRSNEYFKGLALAATGLKSSPDCNSPAASKIAICNANLINGLTLLAQKQVLGPLLPKTGLERKGNLRDLNYIVENNVYQHIIDEFNTQAQKDLGRADVAKKIRDKIFPDLKSLIIARLNQLDIPDQQRSFMISKVRSISFDGTNCDSGRGGSESLSSLLVTNAYYNPEKNSFKFCGGYMLQSTSEFQIATSVAHELSHSIDPCQIAAGPAGSGFKYSTPRDLKKSEQEYPIRNIIQCLRDTRSVGAQKLQSSTTMGSYGSIGNIPVGTYGAVYGVPAASPAKTSPMFCDSDQITESFADWMSAEVVPTYIQQSHKLTTEQYRLGYGNARRLICGSGDSANGATNYDEHPAMEKRINRIILVNPKIRAQMGCSPKHSQNAYCDPSKPLENSQTSPVKDINTNTPAGAVR